MEDNLFRMYDTNMDGVISMEEFLIFYHVCSEGTPEQNLMKEISKAIPFQIRFVNTLSGTQISLTVLSPCSRTYLDREMWREHGLETVKCFNIFLSTVQLATVDFHLLDIPYI